MDFDDSLLAGLQDALPEVEFRQLLTDYLESTAVRLARAQAFGAAGDWKDLAFEAHTLVSTSGSYGLARASALARGLERACKSGDAGEAATLLPPLIASVTAGCDAMRARFLGGSGSAAAA
jgi:HPt (histidine-containing phosphotransfer) domain-containing protein